MDQDPPVRFPKYSSGALKTSFIDTLDTWRVGVKLNASYGNKYLKRAKFWV